MKRLVQYLAMCLPAVCTCSLTTTNVALWRLQPAGLRRCRHHRRRPCGLRCRGRPAHPVQLSITAGSYAKGRLRIGSNGLAYNRDTNASHTTIWGDGSSTTQLISANVTLYVLGLAPSQNFHIYARIPGRH